MQPRPAENATASLARTFRERLRTRQDELQADFEATANTAALLKRHSRSIDELLCEVWTQSGFSNEACLVAVGGYGRGELFPYSDVDLLILLPNGAPDESSRRIEALIGLFWDIGLAVGHSVRNIDECIDEARKDITVQTNLLEARLLTGNKTLYLDFTHQRDGIMDVRAFYEEKMREQSQRHARFNDTAYNLEPNIKESPGGLRDLQNVLWIARSLGLGKNWNDLAKQGLISLVEAGQIRRHELHLQTLRTRLHYLARRREDRLLFDFQNELASELGYRNTERRRASEQLMHGYYSSAKFVIFMNEILLQLLREHAYPDEQEVHTINARFEARNNLLSSKTDSLLQHTPSAILESFLLLEQHTHLNGMSANLLRNLHRVKTLVNREFRQDPVNKKLFLQILQQPNGVIKALKLMNRYGILGRYIPAFGRIVGQMQHDLFHVYTVDEHILNVLQNLHRFSIAEFAHEFPLCSKLFGSFKSPHLLYLGALFHDIAKGRGGDHSSLGEVDARRFCRLHGLSKQDADLVAWLVRAHLVMSSTAQKSDISDPGVIEAFAKFVGSERRLTALYLLTVADIRGTSPAVWNAWKAKLLENLYVATRRLLRGENKDVNAELLARQQQANKTLSHYGILEKSYKPLWDTLGRPYFLRHESHEIAWHSRLLLAHINTTIPIVRSRLSPGGEGIQVMIYTKDKEDLFARICGFFERMSYNIAEAKIHTTQHGYALDSFLVFNLTERPDHYRSLLNYIEYELSQQLLSQSPMTAPSPGRVNRQVKHMPIAPAITIQQEGDSENRTLTLVAADRPGLLSRIAQIFLQYGIRLHTAKINTLGNRAEDTFLISGKQGMELDTVTIRRLKDDLMEQLTQPLSR
ncbi:MAG TPA: [protein-PII] uridylyltransferase [Methylophilaceae bacterium]|nr:[protein-PII] uridylyltransferase [Methylophilaceae bacterium]